MQMTPFEMELSASDGQRYAVCCQKSLRSIPHRRTVYDATWQGRAVIVKCFEDFFGWYRCRREKLGLERLRVRSLAVPRVLLDGKDAAGHHVLVVEKIPNAIDLLAFIQSAESPEAGRASLVSLFRYLALMNQSGVVQKDMHLGNFLTAESKIYAIDPAYIKFRTKPIPAGDSYRQIAKLMASIPRSFLMWEAEFLQAYCAVRGWTYKSEVLETIRLLAARCRERHLPRALKKTLRNSKDFFVLETRRYRGVFYKKAMDEWTAGRMMEKVESMRACGDLAGIVEMGGQKYGLACYKPKNCILALWYRSAGSPARRDWLAGWKAVYTGTVASKPVALVEYRCGPTWLITEKEVSTASIEASTVTD